MDLFYTIVFLVIIVPAIYFGLIAIELNPNFAGVLATVICACGILAYQELKARKKRRNGSPQEANKIIKTFSDYVVASPRIFLIFTASIVIFVFIASLLSSLFWGMAGWSEKSLYIASLETVFYPPDFVILHSVIVYLLSFYVGVRAAYYPVWVTSMGIIFSTLIVLLTNLIIDTPERLTKFLGGPVSVEGFLGTTVVFMLIGIFIGVIGVRSGRKNRHGEYIRYVLKRQNENVGDQIVQLVHREIVKIKKNI